MTLIARLDGGGGARDPSPITTDARRFPLSIDPLIAEAKQRVRRRRLLVTVAVVLAVAGATIGLIATRLPGGANAKVEGLSLPAGTRLPRDTGRRNRLAPLGSLDVELPVRKSVLLGVYASWALARRGDVPGGTACTSRVAYWARQLLVALAAGPP